jgi:hypothetical protein
MYLRDKQGAMKVKFDNQAAGKILSGAKGQWESRNGGSVFVIQENMSWFFRTPAGEFEIMLWEGDYLSHK